MPSDYAPVEYTSKALQQTRVQLSWDMDDPDRKKKLRRKLTGKRIPLAKHVCVPGLRWPLDVAAEQLKDEDFAAYLGSGSEDEGGDGPEAGIAEPPDRLRALLLGSGAVPSDGGDDQDRAKSRWLKQDEEGDMVATFNDRLVAMCQPFFLV